MSGEEEKEADEAVSEVVGVDESGVVAEEDEEAEDK